MRELDTLERALDAANNATGRALEGMHRATTLFQAIERIASAAADSVLVALAHEGGVLLADYIDSAECSAEDFDAAWRTATAQRDQLARTAGATQ